MEPIFRIENLNVAYARRTILRQVSLQVMPGEVLALVGPNGAGKTTLIKASSGVIPLQSGRVFAQGKNIAILPPGERARLIAVVPQARFLPEGYTVRQTVQLGRTAYLGWLGQPAPLDRQRVEWALERTDTLSLAGRLINELSGGEQQRVLLARALCQDPPVLLLDEPTTHLDIRHQASLLNLVREIASERQMAVLVALHDLNMVGIYTDRVALLVDCELRAIGAPHEVLTAERLFEAYQTHMSVIAHPTYGTPLILPNGTQPKNQGGESRP